MPDETHIYRFDEFVVDVGNRQLWKGEQRLDLSGRYFDALGLLVRANGDLVTKQAFFDEVWGDVIVSDAALTQCIKDIRRQLGDDASNPRYVVTVPRYGYRFAGDVVRGAHREGKRSPAEAATARNGGTPAAEPTATDEPTAPEPTSGPTVAPESTSASGPTVARESTSASGRPLLATRLTEIAWWTGSGTVGGGFAGLLGGLLYGSALAYGPSDGGIGTASVLMVLLSLSSLAGLIGGFGVSLGMASASALAGPAPTWSAVGGALGGLAVGAATKLLGVDAFTLFFGEAPLGITGGLEGAVLGGLIALGVRLSALRGESWDSANHWRPVMAGGLGGAVAGTVIPWSGGNLLGGSLQLLADSFDGSQLPVESLGRFFGEVEFGVVPQTVLGGVEGFLFGCGLVGAIIVGRRLRASL